MIREYSISSSGGHFVQRNKINCAILAEKIFIFFNFQKWPVIAAVLTTCSGSRCYEAEKLLRFFLLSTSKQQ